MKNKKINLKTLENVLSEKELKDVIGGKQKSGACAGLCNTYRDCAPKCDCRMDMDEHYFTCKPEKD